MAVKGQRVVLAERGERYRLLDDLGERLAPGGVGLGRERRHQLGIAVVPGRRLEERAQENARGSHASPASRAGARARRGSPPCWRTGSAPLAHLAGTQDARPVLQLDSGGSTGPRRGRVLMHCGLRCRSSFCRSPTCTDSGSSSHRFLGDIASERSGSAGDDLTLAFRQKDEKV